MCMNPAKTRSPESVRPDEGQHLVLIGLANLRQAGEQRKHFAPALQAGTGQLADDEGMTPDFGPIEQRCKVAVVPAKVIYPDGCVNEH